MEIRVAKIEDLESIMQIISEAKQNLKEQGVNQWQRNYPNHNVIELDIKNKNCYVLEENGQVAASFSITFDGDEDYERIYNGSWSSQADFAVVHRVAVGKNYQRRGFASKVLQYAEELSRSRNINYLKIDTHQDNIPMRRVLIKNCFCLCGLIDIADGSSRIVYDKIFI